jgi:hypothetical protein
MRKKKMFHNCELCGKRLIERMPNGLLRFRFGEKYDKARGETVYPVVDIKIHGSVQMKCFRSECRINNPDHVNTINFFTPTQPNQESQSQEETGQNSKKEGGEA